MQTIPSDRTAIDDAYDNAAHFPDVPEWRERWAHRNADRVAGPGEQIDLAYGPEPKQRLDLFRSATPDTSVTAIFFHGGFWTRNSKETFRFLVDGFHAAGLNVAFAAYSLAPDARMSQIVSDAELATRWLGANLSQLGLAPLPLLVVGWSAGAHLAALQMSQPCVGGGMGISGVYDLEPFVDSQMNDTLRLDPHDVERFSPALQLATSSSPFTVAFGSRELPAYREQSADYYRILRDACLPAQLLELQGHHHHSVLDELLKPDGQLVSHLSASASALRETHLGNRNT
jgi:arylformamidase